MDDANVIGRQGYVESATPLTSSNGTLTYRNTDTAQLYGAGAQYFDVRGIKHKAGRFYDRADVAESAQVVVIDDNAPKAAFPRRHRPVGQNHFV